MSDKNISHGKQGESAPLSFDFGSNWKAFSDAKLDARRLQNAVQSLRELIGAENVKGRTFLDVGCGSVAAPHFCVGSVLDDKFLAELGTFDIVYAWGCLHHTGDMWQAICNTASLVKSETGTLVMSIYNYHWTSPVWKQVKFLYNVSPRPVRWLLNYLFGALVYAGVWATTRQNPLKKERGMDFWYDVIDWLGGYPYEYARVADVVNFVYALGFQVEQVVKTRGWTGCNEFVFKRSKLSPCRTERRA
jgi:2-polyprenyl-6-hydroxyphenyl methylase/3-demethylubiquinone-9 3-methyltransferase